MALTKQEAEALLTELGRSQLQQNEVLRYWLKRLARAASKLVDSMKDGGPRVRPRRFRFSRRSLWPVNDMLDWKPAVLWMCVRTGAGNRALGDGNYDSIIAVLQTDIEYKPRRALQAIRGLQAAVAWCEARRAGHERARLHDAQLTMQSRAQHVIRAEAVLAALTEG